MPKECAVCKQTAVIAARVTRGEQTAVVFLCENCAIRLSQKVRLEVVQSALPSIPPGTVFNNTSSIAQSAPTPNSTAVTPMPVPNSGENTHTLKSGKKTRGTGTVFKIVGILLAICFVIGGGFLVKRFVLPKLTTSGDAFSDEPPSSSEVQSSNGISWSAVNPTEIFEPIEMFVEKPTIEPTVLYDQGNICITATGIHYSSYQAELALLLENNTETEWSIYSNTLAYACNSVNGYMIPCGYVVEDLPAHSSVETTAKFLASDLVIFHITDIADIEMAFMLRDDDHNYIYTGPCPIKTSLADTYDYSSASYVAGVTNSWLSQEYNYTIIDTLKSKLYDANNVVIDSGVIMKNKDDNLDISLEVQNRSGKPITFSIENLSINGLIIYTGTWDSTTINSGKKAVLDIDLDSVVDDGVSKYINNNNPSIVDFELVQYDTNGNLLSSPSPVHLSFGGEEAVKGTEIYRSNDIVISQLGVAEEIDEYNTDYHIPLVYTNLTSKDIYIHISYDEGVTINDTKDVFASVYSFTIPGNSKVLRDIKIDELSFRDAGISGWEEVNNISITIEIDYGDPVRIEFSKEIK